jgi:hypothetical protein
MRFVVYSSLQNRVVRLHVQDCRVFRRQSFVSGSDRPKPQLDLADTYAEAIEIAEQRRQQVGAKRVMRCMFCRPVSD